MDAEPKAALSERKVIKRNMVGAWVRVSESNKIRWQTRPADTVALVFNKLSHFPERSLCKCPCLGDFSDSLQKPREAASFFSCQEVPRAAKSLGPRNPSCSRGQNPSFRPGRLQRTACRDRSLVQNEQPGATNSQLQRPTALFASCVVNHLRFPMRLELIITIQPRQ